MIYKRPHRNSTHTPNENDLIRPQCLKLTQVDFSSRLPGLAVEEYKYSSLPVRRQIQHSGVQLVPQTKNIIANVNNLG